jgi:DNA polymerase/3'-5' exonuclease PolX
MSTSDIQLDLAAAETYAGAILRLIRRGVEGENQPTCIDGMVAGSVRRRRDLVSDIELVLLLLTRANTSHFLMGGNQ